MTRSKININLASWKICSLNWTSLYRNLFRTVSATAFPQKALMTKLRERNKKFKR